MFSGDTKILLVDDMPTMRKLIAQVCEQLGLKNITQAGDTAAAWKTIEDAQSPFELIIADFSMPNSTGKDLLARVRAHGIFKATAFLMLTVPFDAEHSEAIMRAGADDILFKPFNAVVLKEKLSKIHPIYTKRKNAFIPKQ